MYSVTKVNGQINSPDIKEFTVDNISDIDNLPHINSGGGRAN